MLIFQKYGDSNDIVLRGCVYLCIYTYVCMCLNLHECMCMSTGRHRQCLHTSQYTDRIVLSLCMDQIYICTVFVCFIVYTFWQYLCPVSAWILLLLSFNLWVEYFFKTASIAMFWLSSAHEYITVIRDAFLVYNSIKPNIINMDRVSLKDNFTVIMHQLWNIGASLVTTENAPSFHNGGPYDSGLKPE